jgi:lysophospholipase L1-like esterase
VFLSTLFALLLLEGAFRLIGVGGTTLTRGRLHAFDPDAGWTCHPGTDLRYAQPGSFDVRVQCNSRGLRDTEHDYQKPVGTRRIVVLGDSFVWGYGVEMEEMFSKQLERKLGELDGSGDGSDARWETINLGVNGYSTVQELVRLETEGLRYQPDWVVLMFCHNDLEDNFDDKDGARPVVKVNPNDTMTIVNRPVRRRFRSRIAQWFGRNSRLFGVVTFCLHTLKYQRREHQAAAARRAADADPDKQSQVFETTLTHAAPEAQAVHAAPATRLREDWTMEFTFVDLYVRPRPEVDHAWKGLEMVLDKMKQLVAVQGARLLVVNGTAKEAVDPQMFQQFVASRVAATAQPDRNRPNNRLGTVCAALGIAFLDLTPAFRRHPDPPSLYLKQNLHWTREGHEIAARETVRKIKSEGR